MTDKLLDVLVEARELGFLGPGPVESHVSHARAFLALLPTGPATVVDLGTGAGIPGLALALWRPELRFRLVDSMSRRIAFVTRAVQALEIVANAEVVCARAEVLGRDPAWRANADLVVARSLAAPAVAAEYAAPLLKRGGAALIAEPPGGDPNRWPPAGLAALGMRGDELVVTETATIQRLRQYHTCPDRFPRRIGVASKRPLF